MKLQTLKFATSTKHENPSFFTISEPYFKKIFACGAKRLGGLPPPQTPPLFPWGGTGGVLLPLVGPPWGRTLPRQLAASKRFLEVTAGFLEVKLNSADRPHLGQVPLLCRLHFSEPGPQGPGAKRHIPAAGDEKLPRTAKLGFFPDARTHITKETHRRNADRRNEGSSDCDGGAARGGARGDRRG